eukprot:6642412-Alexandrium_andersonii.AAC.1
MEIARYVPAAAEGGLGAAGDRLSPRATWVATERHQLSSHSSGGSRGIQSEGQQRMQLLQRACGALSTLVTTPCAPSP